MKAVFLEEVGKPLVIRDVAQPLLRAGGVIVEVESGPVLSYVHQALSGELGYLMPVPFIPGNAGIGRVLEIADDVFDFKTGQLVFLDPMVGPTRTAGNTMRS